jgi:hypothetical protein
MVNARRPCPSSVTEWNELYIIDAAIMAVTCSYAATSVKLLAFRDTSGPCDGTDPRWELLSPDIFLFTFTW